MGAEVKIASFRGLILAAAAGVSAMACMAAGPAFSQSVAPDVLPPPAVIPPPFPFPSPDKLAVPGEGARGGWKCTSSGYATPRYGFNGRNMDGPAPVEAASPCTPPEVNAALDADVQHFGCWALLNICWSNPAIQPTIQAAGGADAAQTAMRAFPAHADIQEPATKLLACLLVC